MHLKPHGGAGTPIRVQLHANRIRIHVAERNVRLDPVLITLVVDSKGTQSLGVT